MSNFDGTDGSNFANIQATESISLAGKYVLPTDKPISALEVIQSTGVILGDGSAETVWQPIAGVGDVVGAPSSIDGEIAVFNGTTGKILKNSSTLVSALQRNPAISVLDMANFDILNAGNISLASQTYENSLLAPVQRYKVEYNAGTDELEIKNAAGAVVAKYSQDKFEVLTDLTCGGRFDINKWALTPNGRFLQLNTNGVNQGKTNFASKAGRIDLERNADNDVAEFRMGRSRGTYASPTAVLNNDVLAEIVFQGNDGTGATPITTAFIESKCNENWTPTARGSEINFHTTTPGTTTIDERLKIEASGTTVQGNLSFGGTLTGLTADLKTAQFIRPTAADVPLGLVWATADDINDGWLLQAEQNSTDLVVKNAALQNVLTMTQSGNLSVTGGVTSLGGITTFGNIFTQLGVSSKSSSTSGVKGSTLLNVDAPVVNDVKFYQSAKAGIQESFTRGRGTPLAPAGLLNDDSIYTQAFAARNSSNTAVCGSVLVKTTEDHVLTSGTSYEVRTTDNGETVRSTKLKLDTAGVTLNDAYTMPLLDGGAGQILETDGAGQVSWNYRSYAEMGFTGNALETTFTPASVDEWQTINAVYQQGCVNGFSFQNGNQLVKTGAVTRLYRITAGASITKQLSGSALARMAIFINGTEIVRSKQSQSTSNSSDFPQHVSSDCIVAVGINDFVEVKIQNGTDDESFTVINLSVIIVEA